MNIYFDECGDNGLNFDNNVTKKLFIIVGILVKDNDTIQIQDDLNQIARHYFGNGQIRSKFIGDDDSKRIKVLIALRKLNFTAYSLLVKKDKLTGPGYNYKDVFYKNLPNKLYNRLITTNPHSYLWADPTGDKLFMNGLKNYVLKYEPPDLFNNYTFDFLESSENRCVQLADFIAGTLMRCFDSTNNDINEDKDMMVELMRPWCIWNEFPIDMASYEYTIQSSEGDKWDGTIEEYSLNQARKFIEHNEYNENLIIQDQVAFIKLLLFHHFNISKETYIPKHEIEYKIASLKSVKKLPPRHLPTKIVGRLRSKGILISSNKKGGYKISSSLSDIYDFLNNINEKITPMINRAEIYWKDIKTITNQEVDILKPKEYSLIKNSIHQSNKEPSTL